MNESDLKDISNGVVYQLLLSEQNETSFLLNGPKGILRSKDGNLVETAKYLLHAPFFCFIVLQSQNTCHVSLSKAKLHKL